MKNQFKQIEDFETEHKKAIPFLVITVWNIEDQIQINRIYYFLNDNIYFIHQKIWKGTWYVERTHPNHVKMYIDSVIGKFDHVQNRFS